MSFNLVADVKVEGLSELAKRLKDLDRKVASKIARKSLRAGAKEVLPTLKSLTPKRTGALQSGAKVRAGRSGKGSVSVVVGYSDKWKVTDLYYAPWIEDDHLTRPSKETEGKGQHTVVGSHMVEKAYGATGQAALNTIMRVMATEIDKAAGEK